MLQALLGLIAQAGKLQGFARTAIEYNNCAGFRQQNLSIDQLCKTKIRLMLEHGFDARERRVEPARMNSMEYVNQQGFIHIPIRTERTRSKLRGHCRVEQNESTS